MTHQQGLLAAFAAGFLIRDAVRIVWGRYCMWKFERDFRASNARMKGCAHERTQRVNTGSDENPAWVRKCLQCWALELDMPVQAPPGSPPAFVKQWCANSAPPEQS